MKCEINDDNWFTFNRCDLFSYPKYLHMYDTEFEKISRTYCNITFPFGKSIDELYWILEDFDLKNESTYLFPGDKVDFYPIVKILKARKIHTCYVSGALIYPGSEYINYKAFLYNKSQNKSYVTSSINLEVGSVFVCPSTLEEFEIFCCKLDSSYEESLEQEYNILTSLREPFIRTLKKYK